MHHRNDDIINELRELKAEFLSKDKERVETNSKEESLSEDFYEKVIHEIHEKETPIKSLSRRKKTVPSILKMVASLVFIVAISGWLLNKYDFFTHSNRVSKENLQDILSQTSSQEMIDYLDENGMPTDDEFYKSEWASL